MSNDLLINLIFSSVVVECQTNFDLAVLIDDCEKLKQNTPRVQKSNYGGWQSDTITKKDINYGSEFQKLHNLIIEKTEILCEEFGLKKQTLSTQLWVNINEKHDFNKLHTHPKSLFSGVFYVKIPENSGNLIFINPNPMTNLHFLDKVENFNQLNCGEWEIAPKENLLLLFSSWLPHQVMPNESDDTRISIAFNVAGD